jgi:hypothetical protein
MYNFYKMDQIRRLRRYRIMQTVRGLRVFNMERNAFVPRSMFYEEDYNFLFLAFQKGIVYNKKGVEKSISMLKAWNKKIYEK